ncbi:hypothetical protein LRAMOSA03060 [Lichtheimia ramosa]|uniref:Uncharacterized protein n=1 Tax=Lichtheimia ramosa TaxID=688394 RepID=A0A077WSZ5_9FUNG|nr:hypothetical protein LRAMOSA03060 [Lichtheimia ramosa]
MQDTNRISKIHRRTNRHDNLMDIFVRHLTVETQLLNACRHKQAKHVEHILEHSSINPDTVRDRLLRTPLHIACSRKDDFQEATNIARILIKHGADVNNGVGDENGMHPMHMAVLAGNIECVLLLLEQGASVPASDPFRLTPLLLAKLKLDNLRQSRLYSKQDSLSDATSNALQEYRDLQSITQVLVTHLANNHITNHGMPTHYGLSDRFFSKEESEKQLNDAILSITDQLSTICVQENSRLPSHENDPALQDVMNSLMEKVRRLRIEEAAVK